MLVHAVASSKCGPILTTPCDAGNGVVTLSSGQVMRPKLLVGADGVNSKVMPIISVDKCFLILLHAHINLNR